MKQLKLRNMQLEEIGFIKNEHNVYKIETTDGYFCYNTNEKYRWYCKGVHLDISNIPELMTILKCFRVKHNNIKE